MKRISYVLLMMVICLSCYAQSDTDKRTEWPSECDVRIKSSADGTMQPAYFLRAKSSEPRPLVVRLHAWSAHYTNYKMDDDYVKYCLEHDFYYMQPEFRGPNDHPEACGSPLVVADIDDVIDYAVAHGNVDTTQIHIIGSSGGGYATMLCYMRLRHRVKTFTAISSISNLVDYYYQCSGRREQYGQYMAMLEKSTSDVPHEGFTPYFDEAEAIRRSPAFMQTPVSERRGSKLFILHGIHDGCLHGDVPFTHSTQFFNKVVADWDYAASTRLAFTPEELLRMMDWQTVGDAREKQPAQVLVQRQYKDKVRIQILEGGHGAPAAKTLDGIESQNVVVLGLDDDAAVEELRSACFSDFVSVVKGGGDLTAALRSAAGELQGMHRLVVVVDASKAVSKAEAGAALKRFEAVMRQIGDDGTVKEYRPLVDVVVALSRQTGQQEWQKSFADGVQKAARKYGALLSRVEVPFGQEASGVDCAAQDVSRSVLVEALRQAIDARRVAK